MRLIDADKFIDYIGAGHLRGQFTVCFSERNLVDMINKQPTIDAVGIEVLRKQLHREQARLYRDDAEFNKRMGGYNPSSFVAGFNYALECMLGWTTFLNGGRK